MDHTEALKFFEEKGFDLISSSQGTQPIYYNLWTLRLNDSFLLEVYNVTNHKTNQVGYFATGCTDYGFKVVELTPYDSTHEMDKLLTFEEMAEFVEILLKVNKISKGP